MVVNGDFCMGGFEKRDQFRGLGRIDHRIAISGTDQNSASRQIGCLFRHQRHHRTKQNGSGERIFIEQKQRRRDVRAIRITHRDNVFGIKIILPCRCLQEIQKFLCSKFEVLQIKRAMSKTSEEPRHAVFKNFAARTQKVAVRSNRPADLNQVRLIASRAVQQQQSWIILRSSFESMDKTHVVILLATVLRRLALFVILAFLTLSRSVVLGQPAQTSPSPVAPIPLTKVQSEAQPAATSVLEIDGDVSQDRSSANAVSSAFSKLETEIESRVTEDTRLLANNPSLDLLNRLNQTWQDYRENLSKSANELTKRATRLDDRLARLNKLREVWQETLRSAKQHDAPPAVLELVQKIVDSIEQARQRAEDARAQAITLLSLISEKQARVQATFSSIQETQNRALKSLLVRDSPPIWVVGKSLPAEWQKQSRETFESQFNASTAFAQRLPFTFLVHGLLIALIAVTIRWMRSKVGHLVGVEPDLRRAAPILSLPISSAFTLSVLVLPSIYPQAPRLLQSLMGALVLVPIVLILRRLLQRNLYPILHVLVAMYFVSQLRILAAALPQLARCIFLGQLIGASWFLIWLVRTPRVLTPAVAAEDNYPRTIRLIARIGLVLLPSAFLANIFGYNNLGNLLGIIFFRSVYLAAALYSAIRITQGLIIVALYLRPLGNLRVVRLHRSMLQRRTLETLKIVAVLFWLSLMLNFFGLRTPLVEHITALLTANLTIGSLNISLYRILAFAIAISASFLISGFLRFLLEEDVYHHFNLSRGIPYAISTMLHYVILLIGFFVALGALGIDLTKITILAGAFSVGIGFGLQNVINNFVSGLILLFERPIKIGDVIEVGGNVGEVRRIGIRASIIQKSDGSEVIVPNGSFISGQVTNWTFSDRRRAVEISFNVANTGDPERIVELLKSTAAKFPGVAKEPPSEAYILGLTAASIAVQLSAWTDSYQDWAQLRSDLLVAVNEALAREKIAVT
jgi:potassium efflux system protein